MAGIQQLRSELKGEFSHLIKFIPENSRTGNSSKRKANAHNTDGKEIRDFYESTVVTSDLHVYENQSTKSKRSVRNNDAFTSAIKRRRQEPKEEPTSTLNLSSEFLKSAQFGHIDRLKELHQKRVNINTADSFGWTALMCASHSGHNHVIDYLLRNGANRNLKDRKGLNARSIAITARHPEISSMIKDFSHHSDEKHRKQRHVASSKKPESFMCEICKQTVSSVDRKSHDTSTAHLFNSNKVAVQPPIVASSTNIGYSIMTRKGWRVNEGLGPEGKGQKYPVKTLLKRDRKGIGNKIDIEARVTHFKPNSTKAVDNSAMKNILRMPTARTISKKRQQAKVKKEKEWERDMRLYMNME